MGVNLVKQLFNRLGIRKAKKREPGFNLELLFDTVYAVEVNYSMRTWVEQNNIFCFTPFFSLFSIKILQRYLQWTEKRESSNVIPSWLMTSNISCYRAVVSSPQGHHAEPWPQHGVRWWLWWWWWRLTSNPHPMGSPSAQQLDYVFSRQMAMGVATTVVEEEQVGNSKAE